MENQTENETEYEKVVYHFRGVSKLAKALGITPQAIYQWDGRIPRLHALEIDKLTEGMFDADQLCPKNGKAA